MTLTCPAYAQQGGREAPATTLPGTQDEARIHFALASRYYETGRFREAAAEYMESYRLAQLPQLLYNAYLSYRAAGMYREGVTALETFIPLETNPVRRQAAEARLASLRRIAARSGQGSASETENGTEPAEAEPSSELAAPQTPPPAPDDGGNMLPLVGGIVAGAGGAMMLVGAITGGAAVTEHASLSDSCAPACTAEEISGGQSLAVATDVMLVGGGIVAAAGVALLIVGLTSDGGDSAVRVTPAVGPTMAGIVAEGAY